MHKLNPITKSIWLTLLLAGGGVSEGLLAAEATEADSSKTATEPSLKTVTVTAQHREETLQEVPVAVSAVQGTSLIADGVRNIGDIHMLGLHEVDGIEGVITGRALYDGTLDLAAALAVAAAA